MHWSSLRLIALIASLLTLAVAESESVFSKSSNDSLLWGPYRPNLYFGIRPRIPNSLTAGLLWGRVEEYQTVSGNVRFTCEQGADMAGYGWDIYDPRSGGVQTIRDKGNGVDVETSFVKFGEDGNEGWGARIKGTVREDAEPQTGSQNGVRENLKTAAWFTLGMGGLGSLNVLGMDPEKELGFEEDIVMSGQSHDLGAFTLTITELDANSHPIVSHDSYSLKPLDRTFVHSMQVPAEAVWQGQALAFTSMKSTIEAYVAEYTQENLPPPWQLYTVQHQPGIGNAHVVQKVFEGSFEFDIFYTPATVDATPTSAELTSKIDEVVKAFNTKFTTVFPPQPPFKAEKYLPFSKNLFSNLIGGIGYFQGEQLIDRSYDPDYDENNEGFHLASAEARARNEPTNEGPYELFTSVPSRPFFPRGFLWDEGFHLLPIVDWDAELVMQVVSSWFNLMDEDGWIAREVILGREARSKVPQEFQTQYPHYANPPTLFMVLEELLDNIKNEQKPLLKDWLKNLYPLLQRNWNWYRKTQSGDLKSYDHGEISNTKEAYRWRGRTPQHILTSGLDDYPRAQPPHPGELHTDLISWMGMMTRSLARVARFLDETEDAETYKTILTAIRKNIDDLHWDAKQKTYCDVTIDEAFEESVHVCHKGYISIFPFMTGLMGPEHKHLGDVLDLIKDKSDLWSEHGIRSLSQKDEHYGTEENYWRSPVWMNMNYLILTNLLDIAEQAGSQQSKASKMYTSLRKNLVNTVYKSWAETGFAWEQYNPETGVGQRTQHFTGWTSLIVKIIAMPETPQKDGAAKRRKGHDEL